MFHRAMPGLLAAGLVLTACGGDLASPDASDARTHGDGTAATDALHDGAIPGLDSGSAGDANGTDDVAPDAARTDSGSDGARADTGVDAGMPAVHFIGRVDRSDPAGPRFEWSGTGFVARFSGTGVTLRVRDNGNYFRIAIDGTMKPDLLTQNGTTDYVLGAGLAAGTHTLEVWRRTEAWNGPTQFLGLTFPAGGALLPPPAAPTRRIEVIGDSITCGYGDEGASGCHFTLATENNYLDYGPVAARALDAEIYTIAWSGWGMYRGYDGSTTSTIPSVYDRALGTVTGNGWDFASWIPDAVVINLGTNDWAQGDPGIAYTNAYVAFVHHLRTHYPDAYILATIGPTSAPANRIMAALTTLRNGGDTRIAFLQFASNAGMYSGCDGHPNVSAQAAMGMQVATALRSALHW